MSPATTAPAASPILTFDPGPHTYFLDGIQIPGVTGSLEECGLIDWSHVPRAILDAAAERGTRVHEACHYLDDGELDRATLDPEYAGYVEAWERFQRDWGWQHLLVEHMTYHPKLRYAGRMDRVGTLPRKDGGRDRVILDFKTGEWVKAYRYQMAAYNALMPEPRLYRRLPLQLMADGQYRSHESKCPPEDFLRDFNVFQGGVAVWYGKRAA